MGREGWDGEKRSKVGGRSKETGSKRLTRQISCECVQCVDSDIVRRAVPLR